MDTIDLYEKLIAKLAQRIVNRMLSEYEWERETVARQVKVANYLRKRFTRYLNQAGVAKDRDYKKVHVSIDKASMFQF